YRNVRKIVIAAVSSIIVLCGAALLPSPAKTIAFPMVMLPAAIILPMIFFSASKLRCPACEKPLPLAFEGAACPACNAPFDLKPRTSARP
ncbi:MAG TPA: hypothetical protein VGH90_08175, partial [Chthoniobacteraceae bacterium]